MKYSEKVNQKTNFEKMIDAFDLGCNKITGSIVAVAFNELKAVDTADNSFVNFYATAMWNRTAEESNFKEFCATKVARIQEVFCENFTKVGSENFSITDATRSLLAVIEAAKDQIYDQYARLTDPEYKSKIDMPKKYFNEQGLFLAR